jgi:ferredoxin
MDPSRRAWFLGRGALRPGGPARALAEARLASSPAAGRQADVARSELRPRIGPGCLALQRVECRVCGEACEEAAIRFRPQLGGISSPQLKLDSCSGCGDCLNACPVQAIDLVPAALAGLATDPTGR